MQYFQGKSVYKGIVMGPVAVLRKNDYQVKRTRIEDADAEILRVTGAVEAAKEQLGRLYDKAVQEVGEASAAIFEVHQMLLEDEVHSSSIVLIRRKPFRSFSSIISQTRSASSASTLSSNAISPP